jgi:hypothetical protein
MHHSSMHSFMDGDVAHGKAGSKQGLATCLLHSSKHGMQLSSWQSNKMQLHEEHIWMNNNT